MFLRLILVHVGVGQRCRALDEEPPTMLPIKSTSNLPLGRWMKVQGTLQAHIISGVVMDIAAFKVSHSVDTDATALRAARVRSKSIGAMEEMSGKVQNASTHRLGRINHEHVHSSRSVQGSQFKGAMERYMRGFDSAQKSRCPATIHRQQ
jgi:hypothetical protein